MPLNSLDYHNLDKLAEWQHLKRHLMAMGESYMDEILVAAESGDTKTILERSGRISAIKDVISLAKNLFTEGGEAKHAVNSQREEDNE